LYTCRISGFGRAPRLHAGSRTPNRQNADGQIEPPAAVSPAQAMARSCASLRPYRSAHSGLASARIPLSDHGQRLRRRTWRITATNPRQQAPSTGYDRATWPLARRQPLDREKPQVGLSNDNYNSFSGDTYFSPLFWVFIGPFLGREVRFRRGIDHAPLAVDRDRSRGGEILR
jgi:hypothetical protein